VCKLIRTKSDVLTLVLKAEYVNEVFARNAAKVEEKEERRRPALTADAR
jgi:hypothetical protein